MTDPHAMIDGEHDDYKQLMLDNDSLRQTLGDVLERESALQQEKVELQNERDMAHAALREISRDSWAALAQTQDMKLGGFAERIGNAADAALQPAHGARPLI
jgi:hypothetical protein